MVRLPLDLFGKLEAYALGRAHGKGRPQLGRAVREALEAFLTRPERPPTAAERHRLLVYDPQLDHGDMVLEEGADPPEAGKVLDVLAQPREALEATSGQTGTVLEAPAEALEATGEPHEAPGEPAAQPAAAKRTKRSLL